MVHERVVGQIIEHLFVHEEAITFAVWLALINYGVLGTSPPACFSRIFLLLSIQNKTEENKELLLLLLFNFILPFCPRGKTVI